MSRVSLSLHLYDCSVYSRSKGPGESLLFHNAISSNLSFAGPADEILVLIAYAQKPLLNAHTGVSIEARGLGLCDKYQTLVCWIICAVAPFHQTNEPRREKNELENCVCA